MYVATDGRARRARADYTDWFTRAATNFLIVAFVIFMAGFVFLDIDCFCAVGRCGNKLNDHRQAH